MASTVDLRELAIDRSDTGRPTVRTRRHLLTRYVLPLALVGGFLTLIAWASWDNVFPPREVTVIPVFSTTSEIQQAGTPLFKAAGWIEPRPTPVRVAALAPGVVERLLVVQDQPVRAGETIAELVRDDARLILESALAELHLREAELAEAQATLTAAITRFKRPVHLQAALGEAEAMRAKIQTQLVNLPFEMRRAIAEHEAARQDYEGKTLARNVVPGIQIVIAKGKMDSAQATVEELQNREGSLKKELAALTQRRDALQTQLELLTEETQAKDEATARMHAAKARVEQVQVTVAEAKLQLDRMTVRAPADGRVYQLIAHPGARIGGNTPQMSGHDGSTVVTMYDPNMLQVRVDVRFEDVPKIRLDQPVEIDNPSLESPITGRVLFVSSEADIQKNTLQVKVAIPEPPAVFKPEMLVDVTFLAPDEPNRRTEVSQERKLYALQQLIQQDDGGTFVWVADQSAGVARKIPVGVGPTGNQGLVEVTSGLTLASRLISSNREGLNDGDRIHVVGEEVSSSPTPGPHAGNKAKSIQRLPEGGHH
ncbi:MAG: HlyD family efflux transporter periplasmic adaptor subunit [Planctomycetaceae bacterium]|nr:HlyD family efflux transporter periplasmic adaptor subunit [Planctomycetaceae bacterium]